VNTDYEISGLRFVWSNILVVELRRVEVRNKEQIETYFIFLEADLHYPEESALKSWNSLWKELKLPATHHMSIFKPVLHVHIRTLSISSFNFVGFISFQIISGEIETWEVERGI
jgi:hypothetical protein